MVWSLSRGISGSSVVEHVAHHVTVDRVDPLAYQVLVRRQRVDHVNVIAEEPESQRQAVDWVGAAAPDVRAGMRLAAFATHHRNDPQHAGHQLVVGCRRNLGHQVGRR